jgi:hypothetical protein
LEIAFKIYHILQEVQQRVNMAQIDMRGLIPATMHGDLQIWSSWFKDETLNRYATSEKTRPVKIPIWIRDTARPTDGSAITIQQYHDSGADMWVNGREMRKTGDFDMKCGASNSHNDEWLCCGAIPESIITNVMPFDGNKVHRKKGYEFVRSIKSMEIYIWNFDEWIWEHNPDTTDYRPYRLAKLGDKRLAPDDDEGDDEGDDDEEQSDEQE